MSRVIGIVSGKGGVGKTTVAVNLGSALAKHHNKKVTVVDCNITTSHLGLSLGMYYWPTNLNKVLKGEVALEDAMLEHTSGMRVLPASIKHKDITGVDLGNLRNLIKQLSKDSDVIILDASPGLGREAMLALNACEEVLFVAAPTIPSAIDVVRCREVAEDLGKTPLGIVLNQVEEKEYELTKADVERLTGMPVISVIPRDHAVGRSLAKEIPVVMLEPKSKAGEEMLHLSSKIIGAEHKRREGFFVKLLKRLRLK